MDSLAHLSFKVLPPKRCGRESHQGRVSAQGGKTIKCCSLTDLNAADQRQRLTQKQHMGGPGLGFSGWASAKIGLASFLQALLLEEPDATGQSREARLERNGEAEAETEVAYPGHADHYSECPFRRRIALLGIALLPALAAPPMGLADVASTTAEPTADKAPQQGSEAREPDKTDAAPEEGERGGGGPSSEAEGGDGGERNVGAESDTPDSPGPESEAPLPAPEAGPMGSQGGADTSITQRVYLEFRLCPTAIRLDRTLGDMSLICSDGEPLGRVVIGLYGKQVPVTVQHFVDMVTGRAGSSYKGSIIHRSLPGQYILAGRQGATDKGEVRPPQGLDRNPEPVSSRAFLLDHGRPGTVSLALSENDDEEERRLSGDYRNVEFLITTGPGPASQLDSNNIVFGTVLQGMEVIRAIAAVPTFQPNDRIRQFNELAEFLGDERAAKGRSLWNKPLKAVVISDCGVVDVAPPLLPPSLP